MDINEISQASFAKCMLENSCTGCSHRIGCAIRLQFYCGDDNDFNASAMILGLKLVPLIGSKEASNEISSLRKKRKEELKKFPKYSFE